MKNNAECHECGESIRFSPGFSDMLGDVSDPVCDECLALMEEEAERKERRAREDRQWNEPRIDPANELC